MSILFITLILGGTALLSWPLGKAMTWAMNAPERAIGFRYGIESIFQRLGGKMIAREQGWKQYAFSMLLFNAVMFVVVFVILSLQPLLPLNPDGKGSIEPSLIFNTVASFTSNTNLQHYSGEVSLSYFSQLFGLMWLQFVSAATGIAALAALARGLAGKTGLGNFYSDLMRATFLILLPLATIGAVILVLGGVAMTLDGAAVAKTLEGAAQTIARGPVAAFVTIKQLGTNGGGFFGPNSTHPFENPTFFTNIIECVFIILIPMACVWMFGRITGRMRHAAVVFAVMGALLVAKVGFANYLRKRSHRGFRRPACRSHRQPGRQGTSLRLPGRTDVGGVDDIHQQRFGGRHARQFQPAYRAPSDDRNVVQRHLWRSRRRDDQYVSLHHRRRVHQRHDGGPHTGIPGPQGRDARDEVGPAGDSGASPVYPGRNGHLCCDILGCFNSQQSRLPWVF